MTDDKLTIDKLLSEDDLKALAETIVRGDIDNIILIYRDKEEHSIKWNTSVDNWATVFGIMAMVGMLMRNEWSEVAFGGDEE